MSQKGTHKKQQTGEATLFNVFYLIVNVKS